MQGLPEGIAHEWSGQSFEERLSGAQAPALFALSVLIVFLALAALYESWSIPLAVILVVPLGVLGALLGVSLRGLPNDIYFKVGLITIIGLSAKNAILIIEVAKDHYQEGMSLAAGDPEAARLRLRPIVSDLAGVRFSAWSRWRFQRRRFRRPGRHRHRGARRDRHRHGTRGCSWYRCSSWWSGARSGCARRRAPATRPRSPRSKPDAPSETPLPLLALCVGLLGACSPTPRQPRAAPIVPANGPDLRGKLDDWQQQFTDPLLRQMIGYAPALSGAQA